MGDRNEATSATRSRKTKAMKRMKAAGSCIILVLAACTSENAFAEHWVQASPTDSRVWYDADNVRPTADGLIGVWVSTGPKRTNPGVDGMTSYPTYSIINCLRRTAGSKMSLDVGKTLMPYASNSGMGELIEKLCP